MQNLIAQLDIYFGQKAPALPKGVKDFLVKFGPYLVVLGLILSILGGLSLVAVYLGGFALLSAMGTYGLATSGPSLMVSLAFMVVTIVIYAMALPGLFKRTKKSWELMFYALLVSTLQSLIRFDVIGLVIGFVIGAYILFQIRSYYTN